MERKSGRQCLNESNLRKGVGGGGWEGVGEHKELRPQLV